MAAIATIAAEIGEAHMPICEATAAMEAYNYTRALEATETFFT